VSFELGVILPNFGARALRDDVALVAEAAEELGFDSIWTTEHLLVGTEAVERFGRTLDSLSTLAWLAARVERVRLGTSVLILPLHHPVRLAKEAATLQELSGGRLRLGVGVGWHRAEFDFFGAGFADRGRRSDESIRLMRALWAGAREFHGEYWSFEDATFGPLPDPPPGIWVGGESPRAQRRARELGDVWHPNARDPEIVRRGLARWPNGRIVPRVRLPRGDENELARWLEGYAEAGAAGLVITFGRSADEARPAMHALGRAASALRPGR
jgi:probable F420-dependent oxidoreductase